MDQDKWEMAVFRVPEHEEGQDSDQVHISRSENQKEIPTDDRRWRQSQERREGIEKYQDFIRHKKKKKTRSGKQKHQYQT